ncbi:hypothetical protein EZV62_019120 [Acer yangbiense]|uniref:WAT1-related protein n=1 Tax=Acer yangbiense TaxID=1000413 RepID=A0A5C7HAA0_9ROSI|nr:hypothetical protein EZV62_019120 [Acer yangbiense]
MLEMGHFCNLIDGLKPALMMVVVQVVFAGVNVFYKLAANDGMSLQVIVAYRFIFATAFMIPLALVLERNSRPKLTWTILFQAFICGLFAGSLAQNFHLKSLTLTSATFVSATSNLVPAITFILSISFGLEKLRIRTMAGKAKVLGTLMGIGGAMLLTFYKGVEINITSTHIDLLHHDHPQSGHMASSHASSTKYIFGLLLALGSCFSYALWLIVQTKMSERYPCQYSSTALMCLMGSIQATVYALCIEKDIDQWKLGWNIRLLTVVYSVWSWSVWFDGDTNIMVCEEEGTSLCFCLQPAYACGGSLYRFFSTGREATSWQYTRINVDRMRAVCRVVGKRQGDEENNSTNTFYTLSCGLIKKLAARNSFKKELAQSRTSTRPSPSLE